MGLHEVSIGELKVTSAEKNSKGYWQPKMIVQYVLSVKKLYT